MNKTSANLTSNDTSTDPVGVVERFFAAMTDGDAATAAALLADDILYVNVGLPPVRGRRDVEKILQMLNKPGRGFEAFMHAISADGPVVLTERTDVLISGRFRLQLWVWGRLEVHNGKITLWRDSFDYLDIARGTVRGVLGTVLPSFAPRTPTRTETPPGR